MSNAPASPAARAGIRFECVVPILQVANLRASLHFYENLLGFGRDWGGDAAYPDYAGVSRGRGSLMLCEGGQGNPGTWVWFGVENAEALHEEYKAVGAPIILPPTNYPWAIEFRVRDPDGHVLRFGSEPKSDIPFAKQR